MCEMISTSAVTMMRYGIAWNRTLDQRNDGTDFFGLGFMELKIRVDLQLTRTRGGKYYVEKTKTENGIRFIYMTDEAKAALKNIIYHRQAPRKKLLVDSCTGFLLLDKNGKPKAVMHLKHPMK